jgi:hypothetical protein
MKTILASAAVIGSASAGAHALESRDKKIMRCAVLTITGMLLMTCNINAEEPMKNTPLKADLDKADKGAYALTLTEFPDPDGQWTYFQLADPKSAVEDELLSPGNK